jgi:hypothetical protein
VSYERAVSAYKELEMSLKLCVVLPMHCERFRVSAREETPGRILL